MNIIVEEMQVKIPTGKLTPAEVEVVEYLLEGLTNDEIAIKRKVSVKTVKAGITSIYKKTNMRHRAEFMAYFYKAVIQEILDKHAKDN